MNTTDLKNEISRDLGKMQTLRDEVRLKLHLAGMDAKDEWNKLEPQLLVAERAAETFTEESYETCLHRGEEAHLVAHESARVEAQLLTPLMRNDRSFAPLCKNATAVQ